MPLHLFADRELALQVGDLLFFYLTMLTPALFEEIIARFLELPEDLLPEFFRNGANLFPLRLQCLQLSRNRLPVCAFLQLTSTCYQLVLELQVLFTLFVKLLEERVRVAEELFEGRPEPLVHFLRLGARKSSYLLPTSLQFEDLLRLLIPLLDAVRLKRCERLHLVGDLHLAIEVDVQLLLSCLQVCFAPSVDGIRRCLEALPPSVFVFHRHRTDVLELVVKCIQLADRVFDDLYLGKSLRTNTKCKLGLKILLAVEFLEFE